MILVQDSLVFLFTFEKIAGMLFISSRAMSSPDRVIQYRKFSN